MNAKCCIAGMFLLVSTPALAGDVSYQLETSVASDYINRGAAQYANPNTASSQNTVAVTFDHVGDGAVTLSAWNATALADYDTQPGTAMELDLTAAYTVHRGALALTGSYMAALFPSHAAGSPYDGAHEVSGMVGYETAHVTPVVALYAEVVRQQGAYATVGVTHDYQLGPCTVSPTLSVGAAAYRKYGGGEQAAAPHINDVTAVVGGKLDLSDLSAGVYASAKVSYSFRGTPSELAPMMGTDFEGRSTIFGVLAIGIAR